MARVDNACDIVCHLDLATTSGIQNRIRFARAYLQAQAARREARLDVEAFQTRLDASEAVECLRAMRTTLNTSSKNIAAVSQQLKEFEEEVLGELQALEEKLDDGPDA